MKYQAMPYDELQTIVAAIPHPSDSPTSAAPATTQKPTNGIPARMSITGIAPGGMSGRLSININAAITSVTHGTRNIPTVDTIFAVVYWIAETGRLIRNARFCFFRSLSRFEIGSMLPKHDQRDEEPDGADHQAVSLST